VWAWLIGAAVVGGWLLSSAIGAMSLSDLVLAVAMKMIGR